MSPDLNYQPGTMYKEQRNQALLSYAAVLQKETETGPKMGNVIIPRINKLSCVVLYYSPKKSEFPPLKEN